MNEKNSKTTLTRYKNAVECKMHNKRVVVVNNGDEALQILIKNFNEAPIFQTTAYKKIKKNLHYNGVYLTKSTAKMLLVALHEYLLSTEPKNS